MFERAAAATLIALASLHEAAAQTPTLGWPLSPSDEDRPLLTTLEYVEYTSMRGYAYLHEGVDLPCAPYRTTIEETGAVVDPDAPWAVAPHGGSILQVRCDGGVPEGCSDTDDYGCWAHLEVYGGEEHVWGHLDCGHFSEVFLDAFQNPVEQRLESGAEIARIAPWPESCDGPGGVERPSHLHFEVNRTVASGGTFHVAAASLFTPFGAEEAPRIEEVILVVDDAGATSRWTQDPREPIDPSVCRSPSGPVDFLVRYESTHRAGKGSFSGDRLGPRWLRYAPCGEDSPDCEVWRPYVDWIAMPAWWSSIGVPASIFYSIDAPGKSDTDYTCGNDVFWAVPTNVVSNVAGGVDLSDTGAWDPAAHAPGFYTLNLEIADFAGLASRTRIPVCVGSTPKLLVRDCEGDDGAEPSPCEVWSESPDLDGADGSLTVCVRNVGNAAVDSTSGSRQLTFAFEATRSVPVPAGTSAPISFTHVAEIPVADLRTRAKSPPLGGWSPGQDRCTSIVWPPAGAPADWRHYGRVQVSVSRDRDVPNASTSVQLDNNRARRTLAFGSTLAVKELYRTDLRVDPSPPSPPIEALEIEIRSNPVVPRRDLRPPGLELPSPWIHQLHVGPGVEFHEVLGGVVVGVMRDDEYRDRVGDGPLSPGDPGLHPAGRAGAAGARTDLWRIVTIPPGAVRASIVGPRVLVSADVTLLAWPLAGASGTSEAVVRVLARRPGGGAPVEIDQRVLRGTRKPRRGPILRRPWHARPRAARGGGSGFGRLVDRRGAGPSRP